MANFRAILQGHLDAFFAESVPVDIQWSVSNGVGTSTRIILANGDNTIPVPAGTTLILMVPPITTLQAKILKGAAGDTGITLTRNQPAVIPYVSGAVILNSAGAETGSTLFYFL